MQAARLATFAIVALTVIYIVAAGAGIVAPPDLYAKLAQLGLVLVFGLGIAAIAVLRKDIGATAARATDAEAALAAAEAATKKSAGSYPAIASASEEIVEKQARLTTSLKAQDGAIRDTRTASGAAMSEVVAATESAVTLQRSVVDSSAAIEQMVSSIRLVSGNIGNLADTVNSVSSAIGELAVSIGEVATNAQEANTLSLQADTKARDGGKAVERLVTSTREIASDIATVVKKMEELGSASERIGNIVEVIDTIADQTNLLALNAAIEAARAGEHGRGFAVVADEVRKLAENSASSTKEIGMLIKDIQAKTDEVVRSTTASGTKATDGLQMADLAGRAIADISNAVAEASRLIEQISTAAREQAAGSSAIVNSVEQMNMLMREAARSLDEQDTSNTQMMQTIAAMQRLTDQVNAAVQRQRSAYEQIDDAARRLEAGAAQSLDANAAIEGAAHVLRDRAMTLNGGVMPSHDLATMGAQGMPTMQRR